MRRPPPCGSVWQETSRRSARGTRSARSCPARRAFTKCAFIRRQRIGILEELDPETIREAKQELKEERQELLQRLQRIQDPHLLEEAFRNHKVDAKELSTRKLDPALKRKMRVRILAEAGADLLLPAPVQIVYHAWQLVTLKSF